MPTLTTTWPNTLSLLHRLDAAERAYRRSLELAPNDYQVHNNLGTVFEVRGQYDEALAEYETALRLNPEAAESYRNRAMIRLRWGDLQGAWKDYEWRWRWAMPNFAPPKFAEPRWQGEPIAGKTILLRG